MNAQPLRSLPETVTVPEIVDIDAIPTGDMPGDKVQIGESHVAKAKARLEVIHEQHCDLARSLGELLGDIFAGRKRLRVYRHFKMYNDPTMNPYLYAARRPAA